VLKYHTMKIYSVLNVASCCDDVWGNGGIASHILNLSTRWGEWSASCPGHFIPGERAPSTHWTGGWLGPRMVCMYWWRDKSLPLPEIRPWLSSL